MAGSSALRHFPCMRLDHERLEVYRLTRELRRNLVTVTRGLPRGNGELLDQLNRAALSVKLNIAEGTGEYSAKEKARFYRSRDAPRASAPLCSMMRRISASWAPRKPRRAASSYSAL